MAKAPTKAEPGDVNAPVQDETKYEERFAKLEQEIDATNARISALEKDVEDGKLNASNFVNVSALDNLVTKDDMDGTVREAVERMGSALQALTDKVDGLREAQAKATRDGPHRDTSTLPRTEDL